MTAKKKTSQPDRIRGFTSLDDHEAEGREGHIKISEIEGYQLRRIWRQGEWWHSVVDVVGALTESKDPGGYWRNTKKRLLEKEGAHEAVPNCYGLKLPSEDGKLRQTDCAPTEALFRIIESIPSRRAEPIKRCLAMAGAERIKNTAQPSRLVDRAIDTYRKKGRDDEWIDHRIQNISARNELSDEWSERGVMEAEKGPRSSIHKRGVESFPRYRNSVTHAAARTWRLAWVPAHFRSRWRSSGAGMTRVMTPALRLSGGIDLGGKPARQPRLRVAGSAGLRPPCLASRR
jgi:hypothetical protein